MNASDPQAVAIRRGIFLPLQIILVAYFTALIFVFWKRRRLQPLRARPFWTTLGTLFFATVYAWEVCMRWVWDDGHPCVVWPLYAWPAWICMFNCLLIRVWLLWFKSHATAEKMRVYLLSTAAKQCEESETEVDEEVEVSFEDAIESAHLEEPWVVRKRHLVSDKFLFRLFMLKTVPEVLLIWANFVVSPASFTERADIGSGVRVCESNLWAFYAFVGLSGISVIVFVFAATRYGKVADGFFLKQELTKIGYLGVLGGPVWVLLLLGLSIDRFPIESLWMVLMVLGFLTLTGLYPITKSYRMVQRKASFSSSKSITERRSKCNREFLEVLNDAQQRAAFAEHLKLEFSVENLLFWEAVEQYRKIFDVMHPAKNLIIARKVFRRFVDDDAPLQVNINHRTRSLICDQLADTRRASSLKSAPTLSRTVGARMAAHNLESAPTLSKTVGAQRAYDLEAAPTLTVTAPTLTVTADVFDDAQRHIVTLMMRDPFVRFQAAQQQSKEAKV